jgi:hypothetical protein
VRDAILAVCLIAAFGATSAPAQPVRIVRIDVPNHDVVYSLGRELRLDIADAQATFIKAYADDATIAAIRSRGYPVTVLVEDYVAQAERDLVTYYSYVQACSILVSQAALYPETARLETLGFSAGNRMIPVITVTGNAHTPAPKPRLRVIGVHHGNEKQGTEICLSLLQYLTSGYGVSPQIRDLVDTREFQIIPVFNPDGHVANRRSNDAGVDLNRDYGWEWDDYSTPYSQPETRALRRHSERNVPTNEYEYHTTAAYVNYLWDNTPIDPPDSAWIIALSEAYADSTYGSGTTRLNPINGWDWYEVHGSCQDMSFGCFGTLATTIETALPSTRPRIDSVCAANIRALLYQVSAAGWGINGIVFDSLTGQALSARIEFTTPRHWHSYTHPVTGDFHKMLAPGTYDIRVTANGYAPKTVSGIVVPATGGAAIDIPLARPVSEPLNYACRVFALKRVDNNHVLPGTGADALGPPDIGTYRVGPSSSIILELDPSIACHNRTGADITVTATGSYTVQVAVDPYGTWTSLGSGSGTQSFDLGSLDSCRYVRINETSSCLLDAVSFVGSPWTGVGEATGSPIGPLLTVSPNPCRGSAVLRLGTGPLDHLAALSVFAPSGRLVRSAGIGQSSLVISGLPAGVYYCRVRSGNRTATAKLVVE